MLAESSSAAATPAPPGASPDWSPEQETALLLDLCEAQMEAAMRDSDQSVDQLVRAFTELVDASRNVTELASKIPQTHDHAAADELNRRAEMLSAQVNNAIVAFQFYDKLSQRMGHVRHSLTTLALFVCNRKHAQQRDHWHKLLTSLRRLYRTQEERVVFDLVAEGATADAVRSAAVTQDENKRTEASSVELF